MIVAKGAEAILYLEDWLGKVVLVKRRFPKRYRDPVFDTLLRLRRTINEARLMIMASRIPVNTPEIYDVDVPGAIIRMRYIKAPTLNELIRSEGSTAKVSSLMEEMGRLIGRLHSSGIIHGDPTPANILVDGNMEYVIDFGLGEYDVAVWGYRYLRKAAVDLNVLLRSLESNYGSVGIRLFEDFMRGYGEVVGEDIADRVLRWLRRIRSLARYMTGRVL